MLRVDMLRILEALVENPEYGASSYLNLKPARCFDFDRFHLRLADDGVDLDIDMPRSTWDAFTGR